MSGTPPGHKTYTQRTVSWSSTPPTKLTPRGWLPTAPHRATSTAPMSFPMQLRLAESEHTRNSVSGPQPPPRCGWSLTRPYPRERVPFPLCGCCQRTAVPPARGAAPMVAGLGPEKSISLNPSTPPITECLPSISVTPTNSSTRPPLHCLHCGMCMQWNGRPVTYPFSSMAHCC